MATATTGFGLLLSTFVKTQVAAIFAAAILTMLSAIQFSGFLTPVASLSGSARVMGQAFPSTYFQQISIGAFTKALGVADLTIFWAGSPGRRLPAGHPGAPQDPGGLSMREHLTNIYRLGLKELFSLRRDAALVFLIVYAFTYAIYAPARQASTEVRNAAVAMVDEDGSSLSRRIRDALLPPRFQPPAPLTVQEIDAGMDTGRYTFVIDIHQTSRPTWCGVGDRDSAQRGRHRHDPGWMGASYIQSIIAQELTAFLGGPATVAPPRWPRHPGSAIRISTLPPSWPVQLINSITLIAMFLAGAALIREREHGTIEHLLVMPLTPTEIMAKIWANGLVIVWPRPCHCGWWCRHGWAWPSLAPWRCLWRRGHLPVCDRLAQHLSCYPGTLHAPVALLAFPVFIIMNLLSGGNTPLDSTAFTDGHAGLTVDAFCEFRPGHPVPRGGIRHGVAGVRRDRSHRCGVLRRRPAARKALTAVQM